MRPRVLPLILCSLLATALAVPAGSQSGSPLAMSPLATSEAAGAPTSAPIPALTPAEPVTADLQVRSFGGPSPLLKGGGSSPLTPLSMVGLFGNAPYGNHRLDRPGISWSTGGPDVFPYSWETDQDLQYGVPVNIELQVNNSGDQATSSQVVVDLEVANYFGRVIHTDQKTVTGSIAAGVWRNVTFTWTPDEATLAEFTWTTTLTGVNPDGNDYWVHEQWIMVWGDMCDLGENATDWAVMDEPWNIDSNITGDDRVDPLNPPHTYSDYHTSPDAWHCGNNNFPADDDYDTNITNASLTSVNIDLDRLYLNEADGNFDYMPEHLWLFFKFYGNTSAPSLPALDNFSLEIAENSSGSVYRLWNNVSGNFTGSWYTFESDCGGYFIAAVNLDSFIGLGGEWNFSWKFTSDNISDPGKMGFYLDDFAILGVEPNPIEYDCYAWKVGEVGLTEPGEAKAIDVYIHNNAVETAYDVPVRMRADGEVVDNRMVSLVGPGNDVKVTMVWTPQAEGKFNVSIYSDHPDDAFPDNDYVNFTVFVYATPNAIYDDIDLLIVDNDHGVNNSGFLPDSDHYFIDALEEYGGMDGAHHYRYNVWLATPGYGEPHGGPPASVMSKYEHVIWLTGHAYGREYPLADGGTYIQETFYPGDIASIGDYFASGGVVEPRHLWVIGHGVLFDLQGLPESAEWEQGELSITDVKEYDTPVSSFLRETLRVRTWVSATGTSDPLIPHEDSLGRPDCEQTAWLEPIDTVHYPFGEFYNGQGTDIAPSIRANMSGPGSTTLMFEGANVSGNTVYNAVHCEDDMFDTTFFAFEFGCIESVEDRANVIWHILEERNPDPPPIPYPTDDEKIYPGQTLLLDFYISNPNPVPLRGDLIVELTNWGQSVSSWSTDWWNGRLSGIHIPGEAVKVFSVNVTAPDDWGDRYAWAGTVVLVNVTMIADDGREWPNVYRCNVTVMPVTGSLDIRLEGDGKVKPGESAKFDIYLRYRSNGVDDMLVTLRSLEARGNCVSLSRDNTTVTPHHLVGDPWSRLARATYSSIDGQHADEYRFGVEAVGFDPNEGVIFPEYNDFESANVTIAEKHETSIHRPTDAEDTITVDPNDMDPLELVFKAAFPFEVRNYGNVEEIVELSIEGESALNAYVYRDPDAMYKEELTQVRLGPAPEQPDDEGGNGEMYWSDTLYLAVIGNRDELVKISFNNPAEYWVHALRNGTSSGSLQFNITVVKPNLEFSECHATVHVPNWDYEAVVDESGDMVLPTGNEAFVTIGVKNTGDSDAHNVIVSMNYSDVYDRNTQWDNFTIDSIPAGQSHNASFTIFVPHREYEEYYLEFHIDPDDRIWESDDNWGAHVCTVMFYSEDWYEPEDEWEPPKPPEHPEEEPPDDKGFNVNSYMVTAFVIIAIILIAIVTVWRGGKSENVILPPPPYIHGEVEREPPDELLDAFGDDPWEEMRPDNGELPPEDPGEAEWYDDPEAGDVGAAEAVADPDIEDLDDGWESVGVEDGMDDGLEETPEPVPAPEGDPDDTSSIAWAGDEEEDWDLED